MAKFTSISALHKYIVKESIDTLKRDVSKEVEGILSKYVEKNLYSAYAEGDYTRTYELIKSISAEVVVNSGTSISLEVYFDPAKMNHTTILGSSNLSLSPGDKVYIPQWVNDGYTWNRPSVGFLESTIEELLGGAKPHIKAYIESMKKKGVKFV